MNYLKELVKDFLKYAAKATYVFALLLVIVLIGIAQFFSRAQDVATNNLFSVNGSAKREITPDFAKVTVGTFVIGKDIISIQNEANTKINKAQKAILALGIAEDKIQTSNYNVTPEYDFTTKKITNYSVNVEIVVEIGDLDQEKNVAGDVIEASSAVGLNEVRGLVFDIKNREEILDELRLEAIDDAKAKKDELADRSGLRLGALKNVNTGGNYYYYDGRGVIDTPSSGEGTDNSGGPKVVDVNIKPGKTELSVTVTLVYEII